MKKIGRRMEVLWKVLRFFLFPPGRGRMALRQIWHAQKGRRFARHGLSPASPVGQEVRPEAGNPLWSFFNSREQGRGIWKWTHYFDIYHRHFSPFAGREIRLLEIGVYSGGSLEMWAHYFGPKARIYGVDIEPACASYANEQVKIFVGDQADRRFWQGFNAEVEGLDIVIDDGGHTTGQQIVSLEELLPRLNPGGIYIVEDIHGADNLFAAYLYGLQQALHAAAFLPGKEYRTRAQALQQQIDSIHIYPYLAVIQKRKIPISEFPSPKRGDQWQPFYENESN